MNGAGLTPERVRDVLEFDSETGVFRWKQRLSTRIRVGDVTGAVSGAGYSIIRLDKQNYPAHRLAWMHHYGEFPSSDVVHINGERADNRINNLKLAQEVRNERNKGRRRWEHEKALISAERLQFLLHYDPDSGEFIWKQGSPRAERGASAGTKRWCRTAYYIDMKLDGRHYKAHRLAWLYVHGHWPIHEIDHIDGDGTNNRIANLRDVTRQINMQNQRRAKGVTKSGLLGVTRDSAGYGWNAVIGVDGATRHIGFFKDKEEAHEAYVEAKRRLHPGCTI